MQAILADASRPRGDYDTTGTWEDWVGWAANAFSNGHDSWAIEVEPELTLDALYEREVLNTTPTPITQPDVQPQTIVPTDFGGYKRVRPAG
jgi:hypothetical protein